MKTGLTPASLSSSRKQHSWIVQPMLFIMNGRWISTVNFKILTNISPMGVDS